MNRQRIEEIANAVLYEGYLLYPYRASAVKNRQRWNFGVLYPRVFAEAQRGTDRWNTQTECLVKPLDTAAALKVTARFLHIVERSDGWQEATERKVEIQALSLTELASRPARHAFSYPASREVDERFVRTRKPIEGAIDVESEQLANGVFKTRVGVSNTTFLDEAKSSSREHALIHSLASAHTILEVKGGEFISLLDPLDEYREAAAQCQNLGTYPVLAGDEGQRDAMLSSPIILYDYPQIAPESAGALFDGTEIDEILTLRIMTLSEEEKLEMSQVDDHARQILERTESMPPEHLMKMHGALRGLRRAGDDVQ
jgi:hydrogenase maturation protease